MSFDPASTTAGFDTPATSPKSVGRRPALMPRFAVVSAVIAAAALRAFDVDLMSLWTDEGLSFYRTGLDVRGILAGEIPLNALITRDVQPPAYLLLLSGWLGLLGASGATMIFAAKWLSILVSLPTVALVWAATRRWAGFRAAAWAAWLAALSPIYLWYAHEVRTYTLAITLGSLATYAGWRALEAFDLLGPGSHDRGRPHLDPLNAIRSPHRAALGWSAIAVSADALLAWTHYLGFFVIGFHALGLVVAFGWWWMNSYRRRATGDSARASLRTRSSGRWWAIAAAVVVAMAASPLVPYAVERLGTGAEKDQRFYPIWVMARDGLRDFALGRAVDHGGLGWQLAWTWWLMAALALLGAWHMWQRRPAAAIAATGWLIAPTIAFFALTLIQARYQGVRHILLQSPPYYILVAAGIAALGRYGGRIAGRVPLALRGINPAAILPILAGAVALGAMAWADHAYHVDPTFHKDDLRGLADHVRRRAVPGDALVLSDPVLEHVFHVYDPGIPIVSVPPYLADGRFDDRPAADHLEPLFEAHKRLWLMTPHDDVLEWLDDNATIVERTAFRGLGIPVRVEAWERTPDLGAGEGPPQSRPLSLGALELLGWEVAPRTLVAGRAARVDLAWLVSEHGGADIKVALRLLDNNGVDWADGDHEPFHGLRSTSEWPFGDVIVEPHDLLVSPAAPLGRYSLAITVYDPATGEVIPSDGPYPIGEVFVTPPDDPATITPHDLPIDEVLHARLPDTDGGFEIIGWRGPPSGEPLLGGSAPPVEIWLRAGAAEERADSTTLRIELVDASSRVLRSATAEVAWDGARAGDMRVARPRLDLPAEAGDYALRLRVDDGSSGAAWMLAGAPFAFPQRGLWLRNLRVEASERLTSVPDMVRRLDVMVGERVELLGADLPEGTLPLGRELPVTLWWRADRPPEIGYHVTVQVLLIDVGDRPIRAPVAQHDGIPASGTRPTTGWASGEVIEDTHILSLPDALPVGRYALIAALYYPSAPGTRRPLVRQEPYGDTRDYVVLGVYTVDMLAPDSAGEPPIRR